MLYHPERLANVDPTLVLLIRRVGEERNIEVIQGARTVAEEQADMASGHSSLKNPLDSKHVIDPTLRPLALAVDIVPIPLNWEDIPSFQALAVQVKADALDLGIALQWGGDWISFHDYDHYELVHAHGS